MTKLTQPTTEYWKQVLTAGGFTALPRWTTDPVRGVDERETLISPELMEALLKRADELKIPLSSIFLAAHVKSLAALSGESQVATGYVAAEGSQALLLRAATEPDTWRSLLLEVHRAKSELLCHQDFAVDELMLELGVSEPLFETVFDPTGGVCDLSEDIALVAGISTNEGRTVLRLLHRTDVLDADCAARISNYHLAGLNLIANDLDVEHGVQSILSAEERRFQIEDLSGLHRDLPDSRVHEVFESRVQAHPDAVAVMHGGQQLTYSELNSRANQLARALRARGLQDESVVGVVTERNFNWIAALFAVLKAGGAYLPIEPNFPAERIAKTLSRAGCELVLTEPESNTSLVQALDSLPGVQMLDIHKAQKEGRDGCDLGIEVAPDQLAYIYFTSGSTGEPKGAMCEQAGMLNHMLAKIEDMEVGEGGVVAQVAPQCFDISLWQLVCALLVGGRTLIVEQQAILDVQLFIDKIAEGGVSTLQVVPSYLEVVLSYLEQNSRALPDLRCVSVTGEALTKDLAQRWFASMPEVKLVNAYGLTETCDDTNHEIICSAPQDDRIPLGRPIGNVRVYLVDETLDLVPLGAPGEIVFSGVCVGRGYINDPERTQQAFIPDPICKGERLYRSGDYGRWRADGKLEFLGRRDAQVKIRGFRVELGEIENRLEEIAGVNHCAVVVPQSVGRSKQLVAFYSGSQMEPDHLQDLLSQSLPSYMVPSVFHWRECLPLTANGKTDKKALAIAAGELTLADEGVEAPITIAEQRVSAVWAEVLGISQSQVGRQDHFFDQGGTSLSAAKLVIKLGRAVTLKDVMRQPILADLAGLVEKGCEQTGQSTEVSRPGGPASDVLADTALQNQQPRSDLSPSSGHPH